jgi:hypothetical protein
VRLPLSRIVFAQTTSVTSLFALNRGGRTPLSSGAVTDALRQVVEPLACIPRWRHLRLVDRVRRFDSRGLAGSCR